MSGRSRVEGRAAYEAIVRACGGTAKPRNTKVRCPAHDDTNPSMSVTIGDDDVVLWRCYAGCDQREVTDALRRSLPDIFDRSAPRHSRRAARDTALRASPEATARAQSDRPHYQHVCFYGYPDESGNPVHRVERKEAFDANGKRCGKAFPQSHWNGTDWSPGVKGITLRLYHLPDIIRSADDGATVWYCEGEKDADRLKALGLVATTNAKERATLDRLDATPLRGRRVCILVDNDVAGRKTADHVARKIAPVVSSVRLLALPGLPEKGDVSDWLDAGGELGHLWELASAAPEWSPTADADPGAIDHQPLTDLGNAERLIARHGANLRYVHAWKAWIVWDGTRWVRDATGQVNRLAAETIRELTNVASADRSPTMPSQRRAELVKHAQRSENRQRIDACIAIAQNLDGVPISADALDTLWWALNVATGTVDLRTSLIAPHRREDCLTRMVTYRGPPLSWLPGTHNRPRATLFFAFLERILPDAETRQFVQRALGYSITGSTRERRLFVCHGVGRNGKTTLLELVRDVIGEGYSQVLPSDILMARKHAGNAGGASPDLASLHGARLVVCAETDQGGRLNEGRVKWVTGEDTVQARRLYEPPFTFTPSHTIWLTTNHRPTVHDGGEALWDRLILIPFDVRIPDTEVDRTLPERLRREEANAVLAWLIEGAMRWHRDGLKPPASVLAATEEYREDSDWFGEFINSECVVDNLATVSSAELQRAYAAWATESSERQLTPTALGTRMRERGLVSVKGAKGQRYWQGLRLHSSVPSPKS